jgi:hypothetical protein
MTKLAMCSFEMAAASSPRIARLPSSTSRHPVASPATGRSPSTPQASGTPDHVLCRSLVHPLHASAWDWPILHRTVILRMQDHAMSNDPSCRHCGAPFIPLAGNQRFCCHDCADAAARSAQRLRPRRQQDRLTAEVASAAKRGAHSTLTPAERQLLWGLPYATRKARHD